MMTRRLFILEFAAIASFGCSYAHQKHKTFEEELRTEVECVLKKYAHEESNESTHRFIEAEIDDWVHMYIMSDEVDMFRVQCSMSNSLPDVKYWVKCIFKKHNDKEVKVLACEVREESV